VTFVVEPRSLASALEHAFLRLEQDGFADALRTRRLDIWSSDPAVQQTIANRLGWVDVHGAMKAQIPQVSAFADTVRTDSFTDVVLLGMGGSSLVSEVLRTVVGVAPGFPRFRVLDSVNPEAIRSTMDRPETTLFIMASKSGSTIELTTLAAEAERRVRAAGVEHAGSHFVAITDENTALHTRAVRDRFRGVFLNPSDIGGRFSALSFFGLVPAALMGIDIGAMLSSAAEMAAACRDHDPRRNPGLALGALMAAGASQGRDKLTLAMPAKLTPLGLWIEQLVAESTGKHGQGVLPVVGEHDDVTLGKDRILLSTTLDGSAPLLLDRARAAGLPVLCIDLPDVTAIGGEFFRWEVATAAAGHLLDINPFDEPNVQQAKDATRTLLETYVREGRLSVPEPDGALEGIRLALTAAGKEAVDAAGAFGFLNVVRSGDYVSLLAYVPPDHERFAPALAHIRTTIGVSTGCATTLGYGPRYLHSTGQLHKGGPDTGVFIIVASEPTEDLPIPGFPYSFGTLELAQAVGDFTSLDRAGRRGLLILLPGPDPSFLQQVTDKLLAPGL
jgi:glucose-6-phosphate isomerase